MKRWIGAVAIGVIVGAPPVASAQRLEGRRIRVTTEDGRFVGTLASAKGGQLTLVPDGGGVLLFDRTSVALLEVSKGKRSHKWTGLLIGAGLGLASGLSEECSPDSLAVVCGPLETAALSAVSGLIVGALIKTESWGVAGSGVEISLGAIPERGLGARVRVSW